MREIKTIIENYAHDYGDLDMSQDDLVQMLWDVYDEIQKVDKKNHLGQFQALVDSRAFADLFLGNSTLTTTE